MNGRTLVKIVMDLRVPEKASNFLTSSTNISFRKSTVLHGIAITIDFLHYGMPLKYFTAFTYAYILITIIMFQNAVG
jgi:hypothetical protein